MNVTDSVSKAQIRAFMDNLDRRWHWWNSHREQSVAPVIPDERGLLYLPNTAENYVVAVTPVDHDMVYVTEVSVPLRVVTGVLAGRELVLVLSDDSRLHVYTASLIHLQTIELYDPVSDLVWADDLVWLVGPERSHVESLHVQDRGDGVLEFVHYRSVSGLPNIQYILWLPLARSLAAVSSDTLHFIAVDDLTVESVPLPTAVQHAGAHDALLVFTEEVTGNALVLDLSASLITALTVDKLNEVCGDPLISHHRGFHRQWHGTYVVSLLHIQEVGDLEVQAFVQSIEQERGPANTAQPELVIHLQEKADFFRLPTLRNCQAGLHYESDPFTLSGDNDPLLVVAEGCALILPPEQDDPEQREREVAAAWVTTEELRLRRQFNNTDGLHYRARVSVYEPVNETLELTDLSGGEMTGVDFQADANGTLRLFLSDPAQGTNFWVGQYQSPLLPIGKMVVLTDLSYSSSAIIPTGTAVTHEVRLQYRPEGTVTPAYTEWSVVLPEIPANAELVAGQVRLYLTTNDLAITPEIYALSQEQIRHVALTTGFWDLHRTSAVTGVSMPALGSGATQYNASVDKQFNGETQLTVSRRERGMSPAAMKKLHYSLGDKVKVQWQDLSYTMHRVSTQYQLGRVSFQASPSEPFNWWQVTRFLKQHKRLAGSQRVDGRQLGTTIYSGQRVDGTYSSERDGETQPMSASGRKAVTGFSQMIDFLQNQYSSFHQQIGGTGSYTLTMTIGDVKHFLGLRQLAVRLANEERPFSLHQHSMWLGHDHLFGASYRPSTDMQQATTFIINSRGTEPTADPLRPAPYHVPLKAVQMLAAEGTRGQRGILGFDNDSYLPNMYTQVSGFDTITAAQEQPTTATRTTWSSRVSGNATETVREALKGSLEKGRHYQIGQMVTSWIEQPPWKRVTHTQTFHRDIWSAKDKLEGWLITPAAGLSTVSFDNVDAIGLRQINTELSAIQTGLSLSGGRALPGQTIKLRAVSRTCMGLDPLAAYPDQTYKGKVALGFRFNYEPGLGHSERSGLVKALGNPSNRLYMGDLLTYLVSSNARVAEIREAIRFALDWLIMRPVGETAFSVQRNDASRLSDMMTLHRVAPQRISITGLSGEALRNLQGVSDQMVGGYTRVSSVEQDAGARRGTNQTPHVPEASVYAYRGMTTQLADMVSAALSGWAGTTATERQRFAKDLLLAEATADMSGVVDRFRATITDVLKGIATSGTIVASDMIRFLTVAYLTGNLPGANEFRLASSKPLAGLIDLVYKTYADTATTSDLHGERVKIESALHQVILQVLMTKGAEQQDILFAPLKGVGSLGFQKSTYRQYRWVSKIGGEELIMPGAPGKLTVRDAGAMKAQFGQMTSRITGISLVHTKGLRLQAGEFLQYRIQAGSVSVESGALRASLQGHSVILPATLKGMMYRVSRQDAAPLYARLERIQEAAQDVRLQLAGKLTRCTQLVGHALLNSAPTEAGHAHFTLSQRGTDTVLSAQALSGQWTTFSLTNEGWSYGQSKSRVAGMQGQLLKGLTPATQTSRWGLVTGLGSQGQQAVEVRRWATGNVQDKRATAATHQTSYHTTEAGHLITQQTRTEVADIGLRLLRRVGYQSPVIEAVSQQLAYGEQSVTVTPMLAQTTESVEAKAKAGSWQSRLQAQLVQWAVQQLDGVPQSMLATGFRDSARFAETTAFRFDRIGMTLGDLLDAVAQSGYTSKTGAIEYRVHDWSNASGQQAYTNWKLSAVEQSIAIEQTAGSTAQQSELIRNAVIGPVSYWRSMMRAHIASGSASSEHGVRMISGPATPAEIAKARYTVGTFQKVLRAQVHCTLWYITAVSGQSVDYLRLTGQQTRMSDRIEHVLLKDSELTEQVLVRKEGAPTTAMSRAYLRRMANRSLAIGSMIAARVDKVRRHELAIGFANLRSTNTVEQSVMLSLAVAKAMSHFTPWMVMQGPALAALNEARITLLRSTRSALGDQPTYHISTSQQQALASMLAQAHKAASSQVNAVELVGANNTKTLIAAIETLVVRWTAETSAMLGRTEQVSSYTDAVELLTDKGVHAEVGAMLPELTSRNDQAVGTELKVFTGKVTEQHIPLSVFSAEITFAEAYMKVIQPLMSFHDALYNALPSMSDAALAKINWAIESTMTPLEVGMLMTRYYPQSLAEETIRLSKQATESFTEGRAYMTDDAIMRHAKQQHLSGTKLHDVATEATAYGVTMQDVSREAMSYGAKLQSMLREASLHGVPMQSIVKVPVKAEFHVTGSLTLPGSKRRTALADVTISTQYRPWRYTQSFKLHGADATVLRTRVLLNNVTIAHQPGQSTKLSSKPEYWFPKPRYLFPASLPGYLQDYGYVSPGLQNMEGMQRLRYHPLKATEMQATRPIKRTDDMPQGMAESGRWLQEEKGKVFFARGMDHWKVALELPAEVDGQFHWAQDLRTDASAALRMSIRLEHTTVSATMGSALSNLRRDAQVFTLDRSSLERRTSSAEGWTGPVLRAQLNASMHRYTAIPDAEWSTDASTRMRYTHAMDRDLNVPSHWVWLVRDRLSASEFKGIEFYAATINTPQSRVDTVESVQGASSSLTYRFDYQLAKPAEAPVGPTTEVTHVELIRSIAAEYRVSAHRNEKGFDLIASRPIGEKALSTTMPVKIDSMGRLNAPTVSHFAREISTVLKDALIKQADKLDYERLSASSEARIFHHYVGDLTNWVLQYWDYKQNRVNVPEGEYKYAQAILTQEWIGRAWYDQDEASLADMVYNLIQKISAPVNVDFSYRQKLRSDSVLMDKIIQAERVSVQMYSALVQAGLSSEQIEFALRQQQDTMSALYHQLKQTQLGDTAHYDRYAQAQLGEQENYWDYAQAQLGEQENYWDYTQYELIGQKVGHIYDQYGQSLMTLYNSLRQMGLSEAQIRHVYEQVQRPGEGNVIARSAYSSYQSMVGMLGSAFEQFLASDTRAGMHYRMLRPMDAIEQRFYRGQAITAPDVIDVYKQYELGTVAGMDGEYVVDMATVLDSIDYSMMHPLPFHDRVDVNLPITFRSEDFRRYKAGIVALDLMQWLRDLRTAYREELIAKIHAGEARGTYSPRAAMIEAVRNNIVEPILYRDPKDGSWLYRQYSPGDTEYNYIVWGSL